MALLLLLPAAVAQPLTFTTVIAADDTLRACYRNPVLTRTARGTLLCFIEERSRGPRWHPNHAGDHSCSDNYVGGVGGHNLGVMRSSDDGASWSPILRLAGNVSNLMAKGGVDFTNNAVIPVRLPSGKEQLLYQYGTQNNPSFLQHGRIFQRLSDVRLFPRPHPTPTPPAAARAELLRTAGRRPDLEHPHGRQRGGRLGRLPRRHSGPGRRHPGQRAPRVL